jgi:hypothetical protein
MDRSQIEEALDRAEQSLGQGHGLKETGFWKAVSVLRRDRELAEIYADRAATIDRDAFERGVRLRVPLVPGLLALCLISGAGGFAVVMAFVFGWTETFECVVRHNFDFVPIDCPSDWKSWLVPVLFLVGFGALLVGTHTLVHWIVGRLLGIRFTHVFMGGPPPPRPGLKIDYSTYLRATPQARAVMHASGAIWTKLVPFALLPISIWLYEDWPWLTWVLVGVGIFQIVTDVFLSTKLSDWKKVRRELRAARSK